MNSELYAYNYKIYKIDFDGQNNMLVYDGVSWGFYVNILNDKVFVLDYVWDLNASTQVAITKNMSLEGTGLIVLPR